MFYGNMSVENDKEPSLRVNINELLSRVRVEKQKKNKVNFIFFALFSFLILIFGIILSF
tara:strand:- start:196 stop:372 length:177 start_codon:yes stop_codon:yes gene_type:complete